VGALLVGLAWGASPATAWAQAPGAGADVARARDLFVQASDLRDQGDAKGALEKFKAAHALAANPITAFELARAYAALGMLVEARDAYASIARLPVQADETDRAKAARQDAAKAIAELKTRVPTLAVKVSGPPDAVSVTLDGQPLAASALGVPVPVDPGTHQLVATGVGGARAEQTIALKEGEAREAELDLPAAAPAGAPGPAASSVAPSASAPQFGSPALADAPSSPPSTVSGNHFGPVAYVGFGIGAVGFVTGTILAVATLSKASSIDCSNAECWQASVDAAHATRDLGIAAAVSYSLAGAGVAVGVADMLLYKPGPQQPTTGLSLRPWIGAGAAGLNGSF